jgi:tRNA nucleotidyltransferase/poly(A) polymerase
MGTSLRHYARLMLMLEGKQSEEPRRQPLNLPVPGDLRPIVDMFNTSGHDLYIVGGAVRDALMNKTPKDYDLATDADPDRVLEVLSQDPELRTDLTGKAFGVVRVKTPDGEEYEIATFRRDIGKGRRPDAVEFTSIEEDVSRRDLTINALFYDLSTGEVVDYVGGIDDIQNKIVKAVGDPVERFDEDRLRILRAVRFAARMGSDLDPETESAILEDSALTGVATERIREEFIKGLQTAQSASNFLTMMEDLGLMERVFPGLSVNTRTETETNDTTVQLALMFHGQETQSLTSKLKSLKYTNDEVELIKFLHDFEGITKETAPMMKKQFKKLKEPESQLQEYVKAVGAPTPRAAGAFVEFSSAPPAATARDLMSKGLKGPELGAALDAAESESYAQLVGEIRQYVRRVLIERL